MADEQIIILDDNLFFITVISGQLEKSRIRFTSLSSQTDIDQKLSKLTDLAIVNLNATRFDPLAMIGQLKQTTAIRILGFCGHGQTDLMEKGKSTGCDWVVPNSVVAKRLVHFLKLRNLLSSQSSAVPQ
jgi:CheY-like chemotaxis protein